MNDKIRGHENKELWHTSKKTVIKKRQFIHHVENGWSIVSVRGGKKPAINA